MSTVQILLDAFPHLTNEVLHWIDICSNLDIGTIDWSTIIFAALPLSIMMLDSDIARWSETDVYWIPPCILQYTRLGLLLHLFGFYLKGCFESIQLILTQPTCFRALLLTFDLWMTTTMKCVPMMATFVLIYWILVLGVGRS